jgi:hypothetical protein
MERRKFTREFKLEAVRPDHGARRFGCPGGARPGRSSIAVAGLGEAVCVRSAACLPRPRADEARATGDCAIQNSSVSSEVRFA